MALPKICYSKIFWSIISASFAFTFFVYGILDAGLSDVKADNQEDVHRILNNIDKTSNDIVVIKEDVAYIKAKIENID